MILGKTMLQRRSVALFSQLNKACLHKPAGELLATPARHLATNVFTPEVIRENAQLVLQGMF